MIDQSQPVANGKSLDAATRAEHLALFNCRLLSEEEQQTYEHQGYLILKSILSPSGLEVLRSECMAAWNATKPAFDPENTWLQNSLLSDIHHTSPAVRQYYFNGPLVDMAMQLIGPNIKGARQFLAVKVKEFAEHPESMSAYKWALKAVERTLEPKSVRDIDQKAIEHYCATRLSAKPKPIKPPTINKDLRHLRHFLKWAKGQGYYPGVLPKIKNNHVREDMRLPVNIPERKFWAMYTALDNPALVLTQRPVEWWRVFLRVLWESGMRRGEVLGLRWRSIDFWAQTMLVSEGSKGRRERDLPIMDGLLDLLGRFYIDEGSPSDATHLLPWRQGVDIRRIYEDWNAVQAVAGVAFRMKDCRSSAGSSWINSGVPSIVVRDMLGHSSVTTTEGHYVTTSSAAKRAAAKARLGGA